MAEVFLPGIDESELLKSQMREAIHLLQLPRHDSFVIGGAVLQLYGIRQSRDIDVVVSSSLLGFIEAHKVFVKTSEYDGVEGFKKTIYASSIPMDPRYSTNFNQKVAFKAFFASGFPDSIGPNLFEEIAKHAEEIDNIPIASLATIRAWKAVLGRPKDMADIALIDCFMEQSQDVSN